MKNSISEYIKQIITLASGTGVAQVVMVCSIPILTRLYSPENFGVFSVFLSLSAMIGVISTGRYEIAAILPKKNAEALTVLKIALLFCVSTFLFSLTVFGILFISKPLPYPTLYQICIWVPIGILIHGLLSSYSLYSNRLKKYYVMTKSRVVSSLTTAIVSISLGLLGFGFMGLIVGKISGQILEILFLHFGIKKDLKGLFDPLQFKKLNQTIYKYINFLKFSTAEALLNTGFKQIPVILLSSFFGNAASGHFGVAQSALSKPTGILSGSVSSVFFEKAVSINNSSPTQLKPFFLKNLKSLTLIIIPVSIIAMLFSPTLFAFVFGEAWRTSGVYAAWLMPYVGVTFVKAPLSSMIDIKNQLKKNLIFESSFLTWTLCSFAWAIQKEDPLIGIQLFSFGNALLGLAQLYWFYTLTDAKTGFE